MRLEASKLELFTVNDFNENLNEDNGEFEKKNVFPVGLKTALTVMFSAGWSKFVSSKDNTSSHAKIRLNVTGLYFQVIFCKMDYSPADMVRIFTDHNPR